MWLIHKIILWKAWPTSRACSSLWRWSMVYEGEHKMDSTKRCSNEIIFIKKIRWRKGNFAKTIFIKWSKSFEVFRNFWRRKIHYSLFLSWWYYLSKIGFTSKFRQRSIPSNFQKTKITKKICIESAWSNLCIRLFNSWSIISWKKFKYIWPKLSIVRLW